MSVTVVLDGAGLRAWAQPVPPRHLLAVMEVLRRHGAGRVVVPSVVTVEALDGVDGPVDRALAGIQVESALPLEHARRAAALRHGLDVSAADAVVAEAALRHRAHYVITSDPDDLLPLLRRGGDWRGAVVTV